jgi:hypothetical protein
MSISAGLSFAPAKSVRCLDKRIKVDSYTLLLVEQTTITVKLDDSRKKALDRFLASLLVQQGVKVNLQEALGLMVDYSLENREEVVKRIKKLPPLRDDPAWRMLDKPDDWGVEDASEKIDEYLYGDRRGSVR